MHIGHEMRRLRAEHGALVTLSLTLLDMVRGPGPPQPAELASIRAMLRDTLIRHLKCEDWILYPRLRASGDDAIVDLTSRFVDEMGHIAQDFEAYDRAWTAERVADDWPGFARETEAILDTLATRIEREESDLYPVADGLGAD